ncbi:transposase [Aquimarina celericrescens]|uniref:Transposase n=1 Tax=Aquimarina celericrescens TaxID=1964542 RepID=A0ABW5AXM2_9FLAO|nr:hypothetical protein [Aquimarina celericrescens]
MSRNYKFHNKSGLYFVSFATVYWIDVFTKERYLSIIASSLEYCRAKKAMELYACCFMPSHVDKVIQQKIDYIHGNPVESGFVTDPVDWKYSSARNYHDDHTVLKIDSDGYLMGLTKR